MALADRLAGHLHSRPARVPLTGSPLRPLAPRQPRLRVSETSLARVRDESEPRQYADSPSRLRPGRSRRPRAPRAAPGGRRPRPARRSRPCAAAGGRGGGARERLDQAGLEIGTLTVRGHRGPSRGCRDRRRRQRCAAGAGSHGGGTPGCIESAMPASDRALLLGRQRLDLLLVVPLARDDALHDRAVEQAAEGAHVRDLRVVLEPDRVWEAAPGQARAGS